VDQLARTYEDVLKELLEVVLPVCQHACRPRPSDAWLDADCRATRRRTRQLERLYASCCRRLVFYRRGHCGGGCRLVCRTSLLSAASTPEGAVFLASAHRFGAVQSTATVAIGRCVTGPWSTGCNLVHLG
jgi:hypothetical protein